MLRNVFLKTLRDRRRGLVGWSVGLLALTISSLALYPSVRSSADDLQALVENLPPEVLALVGGELDLVTGAGFLHSRLFAFLVPLLLMVFAIGFGARTIAGEEQDGTLELVLVSPVPRASVVAQKLAALAIGVVALGATLWISLVLGGEAWNLGVSASRMAGAVVAATMLALVFGTLALALGCAFGRRALATAVTSAVAVTTYLLTAYSSLVESLEGWSVVSPWTYYDVSDALRLGPDPGNILVLAGLTAAFSAFAILAFDRRDVGLA